MDKWTKVRVANANASDDTDNLVWQGFYASDNMAGVDIYVTPDTLRRFVDAYEATQDEWDRLNNPLVSENEALAFGTGAVKVPGTKAIVYPLFDMAFHVVQRFDPTAGREYATHHADGTVTMQPYGAWTSVDAILGNPKPMGFVINEQDYAEGRSGDEPLKRVRMDEPEDITEEQSAEVKASLDTATQGERESIAKAHPLEYDEWCAEVENGDRPWALGPYYDHGGNRTDDPRCELGLCALCMDDAVDRGESVMPALSVTDPRFATDTPYRARVINALALVGVSLKGREAVSVPSQTGGSCTKPCCNRQ